MFSSTGPLAASRGESAALRVLTAAALVGYVLWKLADSRVVDLDVFHGMSLFRHALASRALPLDDVFAYTPTLHPVVHHEWGTGAILWAFWEGTGWGPVGLSVLRYGLVAVLLVVAWSYVRRCGATAFSIAIAAVEAAPLVFLAMSPVRGQLFSLVFLGILLLFLQLDRSGARWWIPLWLALCVVWVNLHAGYVVGIGALALAIADRTWAAGDLRATGTGVRRLGLVLAAMTGILLLTPYGRGYPHYLLRALTISRPLISEWLPLWHPHQQGHVVWIFAVSLVLVAYALWKGGARPGSGFPLLALLGLAALFSVRHLALYGLAFFAWIAPALATTELAGLPSRWWARRPAVVATVAVLAAGAGLSRTVSTRAWRLVVNDRPGDDQLVYPVGAVDHLDACGFSGNVLTHFEDGSYVSWRLAPRVKVSLDSRYEAAYRPGLLEEHARFFAAQPGWQDLLDRYPTDAVLVRRGETVAAALQRSEEMKETWALIYRDATHAIYLRRGSVPSCAEGA